LEDVGSLDDAGGGQRAARLGRGADHQRGAVVHQVGGTVEAGDEFGEQLASGDFNDNGP
jgi:hypothetical protein